MGRFTDQFKQYFVPLILCSAVDSDSAYVGQNRVQHSGEPQLERHQKIKQSPWTSTSYAVRDWMFCTPMTKWQRWVEMGISAERWKIRINEELRAVLGIWTHFDLFTIQSTTGVTLSSKDKDWEMGVSKGLSRQGGGWGERERRKKAGHEHMLPFGAKPHWLRQPTHTLHCCCCCRCH